MGDGSEQVVENGSFAGFDEYFCGHSWDEKESFIESGEFFFGDADSCEVERNFFVRVFKGVGGDSFEGSGEGGRAPRLEGGKLYPNAHPRSDIVDIGRFDLSFDDESVAFRNDVEDGVSRRDDTAPCVDFESNDDAGSRGPNFDTVSDVLSGSELFFDFKYGVIGFAKFACGVLFEVIDEL